MPRTAHFDPTRDNAAPVQAEFLTDAFATEEPLIVASALRALAQSRGLAITISDDPSLSACFAALRGFDLALVAKA